MGKLPLGSRKRSERSREATLILRLARLRGSERCSTSEIVAGPIDLRAHETCAQASLVLNSGRALLLVPRPSPEAVRPAHVGVGERVPVEEHGNGWCRCRGRNGTLLASPGHPADSESEV